MYTYLISVHLLLKNLHTVAHNLYIYKYVYAHTCSNIYMYTHVHIPDIGAPPAEESLRGSSPSFCCRLSRTYPPSLPRALPRLPRAEILERYVSVLQCVAVCCSVLQCVAVCCSVLLYPPSLPRALPRLLRAEVSERHAYVLQYVVTYVATYCTTLQHIAVCCSDLQLQYVAVCCT